MISVKTKRTLQVAAVMVGLLGSAWGGVTVIANVPYRINALEASDKKRERDHEEDHERIIRIEEGIKTLQKSIEDMQRQQNRREVVNR